MKAVITDLDRTLLRNDKSVSPRTLNALRRCRERGIRVLAASARPLRDLRRFDSAIGFDAMTATNGAVVSLPSGLFEAAIPPETGRQILSELLRFPDLFLSIETDRGLYSNRDIPEWHPVVYDRFPELPEGVILYKILVSSPRREVYEGIASVLTDDVYHTVANAELLQIMSRDATKWNGVKRMLEFCGIDPRDAVYFGDDNDDLEPIRRCGTGVAVANAIPSVMAAADLVTASNEEDGIARFLEEHVLL